MSDRSTTKLVAAAGLVALGGAAADAGQPTNSSANDAGTRSVATRVLAQHEQPRAIKAAPAVKSQAKAATSPKAIRSASKPASTKPAANSSGASQSSRRVVITSSNSAMKNMAPSAPAARVASSQPAAKTSTSKQAAGTATSSAALGGARAITRASANSPVKPTTLASASPANKSVTSAGQPVARSSKLMQASRTVTRSSETMRDARSVGRSSTDIHRDQTITRSSTQMRESPPAKPLNVSAGSREGLPQREAVRIVIRSSTARG